MSPTSPIRRSVLPCLVAAIVCGFSARAGLAAEEPAEPKPQPAAAAPAEEPQDELVIEAFQLKHASSDTMISAIRPVAPEAQVTLDSRLNRLIVVAPKQALKRVQQLVQTLDVREEVHVRIFRLKYGAGDVVVPILADLVPDARITVDERSNSLIVAGPEEVFSRVTEVIETLDVPRSQDHPERSELQVYSLQHIDAAYAAETIEFLMKPRESSRAADRVRIEADPKNNRLLVYGTAEVQLEVRNLLSKLDGPPDPGDEQRNHISVYQLHHIEARNAVLCLQKLFGLSESSEVRIDADPESNRLFLYAPLPVHLQVKEALERLDAPPELGGDQQVKVFDLQFSQAAAMAETVSELLGNGDVTISIDTRTNSLIAKGPERMLEVIEALLLRLDEQEEHEEGPPPSATYHVRVVWLASGLPEGIGTEPADDLGDVLAELAKVGVSGLRQVGQAMIHTLPDGQFQITCSPMHGVAQTEMQIDGEFEERQGTPYLGIQLSAKQTIFVPIPFPPGRSESDRPIIRTKSEGIVDLQTEITAPYGHYVVLGVTPVRETTSVFVVRITQSDPVSRPPKKGESADR